jgi:hypothetical protein
MHSVAEELRTSLRSIRGLSPEQLIERAFRLGEDDLEILMAARGISRAEALEHVRRVRNVGRRPSRSATGGQ